MPSGWPGASALRSFGKVREQEGEQNAKAERTAYLPAEGEHGPEAGRSLRRMRLPAHRATSDVVAGAYPFLAEAGLGSEGVYIGQDAWSGGGFCFDPWVLYGNGVLTNPNCLLAGVVWVSSSSLAPAVVVNLGPDREVSDDTGPFGDDDDVAWLNGWCVFVD